ncbi:phosphatidate cytidylyltransferase [Aerococcaceae bacterium zg-ZJ1578]|uniref:phosphatidate cytidylyltransferase n=1 Tax=Aerococcaceae TaxID=186827 RepID=UPI0013BA8FA5|nr:MULTISPECIES: phosphatidate cytidylyltransferase [unclassified Facklamia]MBK0347388.1 phosphatidate cytidylyltransferase [Aerococcaceae bacterium zg-1578]MBR7926995.1 phosphatidate cytidylyltransferase [Aerococcaceae bacterium zg-ZUI334]QQD66363.1 phosphatidate cytidylyltransferase [Aerococcaceae bacterium zg-252]NEW63620.1 phosphatidate cytidylyltransferase [Facklamia sp. 252]NEW67091.1 phosphatidate cytidylyltransferase [Facklamia sp. 253]
MRVRTLSAVIGLAIFIPFILLGNQYFAFAIFVLAVVGLFEIARMKHIPYFNLIGVVATLALTLIVLPPYYTLSWITLTNSQFLFYLCGMALLIMMVYRYKNLNFENVSLLMFGALYVGFGFRFIIVIRDMGLGTLMYLFFVIWATDIGAYLVGRFFGKRPLAPEVSPNKTVEGSLGGVIIAMLVGILFSRIVNPNLGLVEHVWLLSAILSIVGQFGDLVESSLKRHFGVKDSGNFLPGHGGVLDRFDSLIFASFMFMIWLNLFRR